MPPGERPASAEDCAVLLRACADAGRTVRVRGGGTKDHLRTLRPTAVVLETAGLGGILDHVPEDLTVTVGAGMRMAELRDALAAHGQFLPLDPPHLARGATVGGVIAANSNGFARYRYGGVRDLLLGVRVALPDGTVARAGGRVVKNVAGYDLNKLYTGSLGTLGVITEATFKILPIPPVLRGTSAVFAKAADAFAAADAIVRTSLRPIALVVERTAERRWRLIVAAAGEQAPVDRAMTETARAAAERGGTMQELQVIQDLPATLGQLREVVDGATDGAVIRVALPIAAQTAFAESAAAADRSIRLIADAASGTMHVHLRGDDASVLAAADALLANARVVGGSGRVERAVAGLAMADGPDPSGAFLMRRLKKAFDPRGILEPSRTALG